MERQVRTVVGSVVALVVFAAVVGVAVYQGFFAAPTAYGACYEPPESEGIVQNEREPAEIEVHHSTVWIDAKVHIEVEGTAAIYTWRHGLTPKSESELLGAWERTLGKEYVVTVSDNGKTHRLTGTIDRCNGN